MAVRNTYTLRPNSDAKAAWTEVPAGSAFDRLDDAVVYGDAVAEGSDWVESNDSTQLCTVDCTTQALAGGETVTGLYVNVYCDVPAGQTLRVQLQHTSGATRTILDKDIPASTHGWWRWPLTATGMTQAMIDSLKMILSVNNTGAGLTKVWVANVSLKTATDVYEAANIKLRNRTPEQGISIAAGLMGMDAFKSCDLGGGKSVVILRDSNSATAAGQRQIFGSNPAAPAAPQTGFVRNALGILDAYDLDTANWTTFVGAGNSSYFPNVTYQGVSCVVWPQNCFVIAGRLFVVGVLETTGIHPIGRFVKFCDDWSSNPTNPGLWTWTHGQSQSAGLSSIAVGAVGFFNNDAVDGFCYFWDCDNIFAIPKSFSLYRMPTLKAFVGTNWKGGEWWSGSGWRKDRRTPVKKPPRAGVPLARGGLYNFQVPAGFGWSEGSIHKRATDGKFQMTEIFDAPWGWDGSQPIFQSSPPWHVGYALTPGTAPTNKFDLTKTDHFLIPETQDWIYFAAAHPQLTWPGMGANDQVWSYNTNQITGRNTFEAGYYPRWVKALAVV